VLKHIDLVTAWKAISIALTGAFGILGLLTEFKDKKTHRTTKWGWVSLVGIIVSSVCGVAAQLKESHDDAAKSLALSQRSNEMLVNIDRVLSSLSGARYYVAFDVSCSDVMYIDLCEPSTAKRMGTDSRTRKALFEHQIDVELFFFVDAKDADQFIRSNENPDERSTVGNLQLELLAANYDGAPYHNVLKGENLDRDDAYLSIEDLLPGVGEIQGDGRIRSLMDLKGTTLLIASPQGDLKSLEPRYVKITTPTGENRFFAPFDKISVHGEVAYRCNEAFDAYQGKQ
jgi:hypothetical protein